MFWNAVPLKADAPIVVMLGLAVKSRVLEDEEAEEVPKVREVREESPLKAFWPIEVTPLGRVTFAKLVAFSKADCGIVMLPLLFDSCKLAKFASVIAVPEKAQAPSEVKLVALVKSRMLVFFDCADLLVLDWLF